MSDLERYEAAAAFLRDNLAGMIGADPPDGGPFRGVLSGRFWRRLTEQRVAEERDRQAWIADVKRRLGLVCAGELPYFAALARWWPGGVPFDLPPAEYRVIADHVVKVPLEWPPECRCVLIDGEQVPLGGPCPVHPAATA